MADTEISDLPLTNGTTSKRLPVTVTKPIPYTFDLGNLLCTDANPLPPTAELDEDTIKAAARDCAQVLINQLLSTCAIAKSRPSLSTSPRYLHTEYAQGMTIIHGRLGTLSRYCRLSS